MASCDETKLSIGPFLDGELEPHEMTEAALHIVACPECKTVLDDYRALGATLRDALVMPALDGLVAAVDARIAALRPSIRERRAGLLESFGQRFGAALALGAAAATAAILTFVMLAPSVSQFVRNAQRSGSPAVEASPSTPSSTELAVADDPTPLVHQAERDAAEDSQALVEGLEADSPSVALWNEPKTDTTVIWVPDQQP